MVGLGCRRVLLVVSCSRRHRPHLHRRESLEVVRHINVVVVLKAVVPAALLRPIHAAAVLAMLAGAWECRTAAPHH